MWPEARQDDAAQGLRSFHADDDAVLEGQTVRSEGRSLTQLDGRVRIFDNTKLPLRNARGEIYGVLGFARDVTEQRNAERELRSREERYRLLVDNAPVPLYVHDGERLLFANRACGKLMGYELENLVGRPLTDIVHPDERARVQERIAQLRQTAETGYNSPILGRIVRADGELVFVEVVAAMVSYEGRPAIQVVAIDVSERERAREAVRERDAALQKAVEQLAEAQRIAHLGYWEYDLLSSTVEWSDETFRIFELDRDVRPTRDLWLAAVHPDDRPALAAGFGAAMSTQTSISLTYRLALPGDRIKHVFQHVRFESDDRGAVARAVGTVQDVSDREVAAAERAALEAQLRHAQRLESLGTLAAGIAHDFNNLLTAILANAELATRSLAEGHPVHENLAAIGAAGARATELVRQILMVGRRQAARRTTVDPAVVAEEALRLLRATLRENVELVARISPDTPSITADATQLLQVLMNLCTNAWQALEGQRGRIEIGVRGVALDEAALRGRPQLAPGLHAEITVTDTGKGMAAETVERVFDPFFTTKPVGVGSGLGLAVVHGIVQSHQGAIEVTSEPGQGTTFRLYFPASAGVAASVPRDRTPPAPRPLRVMLVDDEAAIVSVFTHALQALGFTVTAFTRAADALGELQARAGSFDVVVSDHRMPEMSGLELAREVRRIAPELPLVLMSGNLDARALERSALLGVVHHLPKPCSLEQLSSTLVTAALEASKRAAAPGER